MKVAILQPGYLPWLGFFDIMGKVDAFVILDDVQYTVRDWRSRNRIKTPMGAMWLTVPVKARGVREKVIRDVEIDNTGQWQKNHLRSLETFYRRAKWFYEIIGLLDDLYGRKYRFLVDVDIEFISRIVRYFSLATEVIFASSIPSTGKKDEKLLSLCRCLSATHYLTGNAAKDYLNEQLFGAEGITVEWHNYQHPYYTQLWLEEQGFISHLSIIDLLFNYGPDSLAILAGKEVIAVPGGTRIRHADDAHRHLHEKAH